jgi:hypothetical protein
MKVGGMGVGSPLDAMINWSMASAPAAPATYQRFDALPPIVPRRCREPAAHYATLH